MKIIVDGKLYNTETAEALHAWESPETPGDFRYYEEILYRTKKGNLFIYGQGGPMSPYSEAVGNNSIGGGEGLRLIGRDEAVEWLESHDGVDVLLTEFADLVEEA